LDHIIILKGSGGNLELEISEDFQWTRCYLNGDKKLLLGADDLNHVVAGLTKALQTNDQMPSVGEINSTPVKFAIHLEETHHSLYYGDEHHQRLLFWQEDGHQPVRLVGVIRLTSIECYEWIQILASAGNLFREPIAA